MESAPKAPNISVSDDMKGEIEEEEEGEIERDQPEMSYVALLGCCEKFCSY